ncbi:hypothetical protein A0H81_15028 [Grifola frondosa]|uniref:Uncharacterized protein n=1 Tax=Grifola frondosa TaxID=5627 RepID=A0A1C7LQ97_GRIFR|nr:hypothetical protein A0H81_15028 [Grifola frondosa]
MPKDIAKKSLLGCARRAKNLLLSNVSRGLAPNQTGSRESPLCHCHWPFGRPHAILVFELLLCGLSNNCREGKDTIVN